MVSSTLLTLIVIPAIFGIVKGFGLPNADRSDNRPPFLPTNSIKRSQRVAEPVK